MRHHPVARHETRATTRRIFIDDTSGCRTLLHYIHIYYKIIYCCPPQHTLTPSEYGAPMIQLTSRDQLDSISPLTQFAVMQNGKIIRLCVINSRFVNGQAPGINIALNVMRSTMANVRPYIAVLKVPVLHTLYDTPSILTRHGNARIILLEDERERAYHMKLLVKQKVEAAVERYRNELYRSIDLGDNSFVAT